MDKKEKTRKFICEDDIIPILNCYIKLTTDNKINWEEKGSDSVVNYYCNYVSTYNNVFLNIFYKILNQQITYSICVEDLDKDYYYNFICNDYSEYHNVNVVLRKLLATINKKNSNNDIDDIIKKLSV